MGNNKSLFCLTCFDEKNSSFIAGNTNSSSNLNHPQTEYEVPSHPLIGSPKQADSKIFNIILNDEEQKSKDERFSSVFFSFKTEDRPKTTSFFSFPPERSFDKSIKEEDRLRSSTFMKSSHFSTNLLENVFKLISNGYEDYENIYNDPKSEMKLKIYMKSYMRAKSRINIFRTEFIAPCLPKEFIDFANNIEIQKQLDTSAESYHVVKHLNERTDILYLSYKKTIITSPRDFLYLKTSGELTHNNNNYHCIVGKSIEMEEFHSDPNTIRCEIINSGYAIQVCGQGSLVRTYSEFDFKINIPLFIVKNFSVSESRKFVENTIAKLKQILGKK